MSRPGPTLSHHLSSHPCSVGSTVMGIWPPSDWEGVGGQWWGGVLRGDRVQGLVTCEGLDTLEGEALAGPAQRSIWALP